MFHQKNHLPTIRVVMVLTKNNVYQTNLDEGEQFLLRLFRNIGKLAKKFKLLRVYIKFRYFRGPNHMEILCHNLYCSMNDKIQSES